MSTPSALLFICMGNICRSPAAKGVFLHLARGRGVLDRFRVDSAGTGAWHVGERPDPRTLAEAARRGIEIPGRARQVVAADFSRFDRLLVMDGLNERDLAALGAPADRVERLMRYHPDPPLDHVPDPYSGGPEAFAQMFDLLEGACEGLLDRLLAAEGTR
jgi:protein-tyrosine phosphatase